MRNMAARPFIRGKLPLCFFSAPPRDTSSSGSLPSPPHFVFLSFSLCQYILTVKKQSKMAKGPKLTKLRSVLRKLNSFGNRSSLSPISRSQSTAISPVNAAAAAVATASSDDESNSTTCRSVSFEDLLPVYVGKSRRRYLVGPEVVRHPLFQELVDRSGGYTDGVSGSIHVVACEVVLFEHLLWMLENADESMDGQLADFYAC